MDNNQIPETMEQVKTQVALMNERGFSVSEDDVIKESVLRGFQDMMNHEMEGEYFTAHYDEANNIHVRGIGGVDEGTITPKGNSFIEDFKVNSDMFWDELNDKLVALLGR